MRWAERLLFVGAIGMFAYCGFVLVDAHVFQNRERRHLDQLIASPPAAATSPQGLMGRIEIRRLGLSVIVEEGVSAGALRRAAGHIPGTALPGHAGNVGIAGHRDTFFRPLRNIRHNDVITLTTLFGSYQYRVVSAKVVSPNDVAVLDPSGSEVLTLVTCYPFYFVGPAPNRYVVRAERVPAQARNQ
ncbi:MAG: class D sortase [Acidobacteriia bacterium]|nr:class D sortase [Terriglobia bacterium]